MARTHSDLGQTSRVTAAQGTRSSRERNQVESVRVRRRIIARDSHPSSFGQEGVRYQKSWNLANNSGSIALRTGRGTSRPDFSGLSGTNSIRRRGWIMSPAGSTEQMHCSRICCRPRGRRRRRSSTARSWSHRDWSTVGHARLHQGAAPGHRAHETTARGALPASIRLGGLRTCIAMGAILSHGTAITSPPGSSIRLSRRSRLGTPAALR